MCYFLKCLNRCVAECLNRCVAGGRRNWCTPLPLSIYNTSQKWPTLYLILVGGPILGLNVLEVWPYKFIHLFELIIKISIQLKSHLNISILYCWGVYFYFYKIAKNDIICFNIYEIRWNKNLVNLKICHLVYHLNYLFNQDVRGKKSYLAKEKKLIWNYHRTR